MKENVCATEKNQKIALCLGISWYGC